MLIVLGNYKKENVQEKALSLIRCIYQCHIFFVLFVMVYLHTDRRNYICIVFHFKNMSNILHVVAGKHK